MAVLETGGLARVQSPGSRLQGRIGVVLKQSGKTNKWVVVIDHQQYEFSAGELLPLLLRSGREGEDPECSTT